MNTTFNSSMFESIKDALAKEKQSTGLKDLLRLEAGATYIVRLIPNIKDPSQTFFHYFNHGWKSVSTGQFVSAVSPTTWGEPDPIAQERFAIQKSGSEADKEKAKLLNRRENWLANVYVVNDPKHPENNGKIKIFRFGRQIHKIIMEAIEGEEAAEFGPRIFDLSAAGCNLKVKAEQQGDFTTFVGSKFASPSEISGMTPEKMQEVYNSIFDLTKVFTVKSYNELAEMLEQHFHGVVGGKKESKSKAVKKEAPPTKVEPEDDIPFDAPPKEAPAAPAATEEVLDDSKVQELLKGLE